MHLSDNISSTTEDLRKKLNLVKDNIRSIIDNSESDFLKIDRILHDGSLVVSGFAEKAAGASSVRLAGEEDILAKAEKRIQGAIDELRGRREIVESRSDSVKKVVGSFEDLNGKRAEIEAIAKYLRAVALNIFIETARSEMRNENFSIIAVEINELSEKIIEMAKAIRIDSEYAMQHFNTVYTEIAAGIEKLKGLTGGTEESVVESVSNIRRLMEFSLNAISRTDEISQGISEEIRDIVDDLRFYDGMRQKMESVVNAIEKTLFFEKNKASEEVVDPEKLAEAHAVLTVQSALVESVVNELNDIFNQENNSFEKIIGKIEEINSIISYDSAGNSSGRKFLAGVSGVFNDFNSLDNEGADLVVMLAEAYKNVSETTESLAEQAKQINEISQESHIKALNAIIATQNMGIEGQTLLTLAGEMKVLSQQAGTFAGDVGGIIETIVATVREISSAHGEEESELEGEAGISDVKNVTDTISECCTKIQGDFEILNMHAGELNDKIVNARNQLEFLPDMGRKFAVVKRELEKIAGRLTPMIPEELLKNAGKFFGNDSKRINKEQEAQRETFSALSRQSVPEDMARVAGDATDGPVAGNSGFGGNSDSKPELL